MRSGRGQLLGGDVCRRSRRLRRGDGLRGSSRAVDRQHHRRDAGLRRLRRHRCQRRRLHLGRSRSTELGERRRHVRHGASAGGKRVAERDGRHRHPVGPLDRARAARRQLRQRNDRQHADAGVRAAHRDQQQRRGLLGHGAQNGLPAGRPAARHRRHGSGRWPDRSRARRRRDGGNPDPAGRRPARGNDRGAERRSR